MEVSQLVEQPESKTLEFKQDLSSLTPILKTIVAFANTAGGILIIGRSSNGKVCGVDNPFEAEEKLANAIADNILPTVLPEIEIATLEGKDLLIVQISHWQGPFYLKKQGAPRGVYVRLGSTSRPVNADMLAEMKRQVGQNSYDQEPVPGAGQHDLDIERIKQVFAQQGKTVDQQKMRSLGLLAEYNGRIVPSIGGLILFGTEDARMRYVPDARVSCARFRGKDKAHFIDRVELEGTIIDAVEPVMKFIARNTRLAADFPGIRRVDVPEYPPLSTREVLINALVHADYTIAGSHTRLAIFDDRLEVENAGMLPFGYTLDDFEKGMSRIRNKVIARTFRELELMEEWGSGYRRIMAECNEKGYPHPNWKEEGTWMLVTFYPHSLTVLPSDKLPEDFSPRQIAILEVVSKQGPISSRNIQQTLDDPISYRTLLRELTQLRKYQQIKQVGSGPRTLWVIFGGD